jgi:hypothetical protein
MAANCKADHASNTPEGSNIRVDFRIDTSGCNRLGDRTLNFTSNFKKGSESRTHDESDILPQAGGVYRHSVRIQNRFQKEGFTFTGISGINLRCSCLD